MFTAGTSFFIEGDSHVWFIISDPLRFPDQVLIVNLTTFWEHLPDTFARKDRACLIEAGEHPFVRHRSCVYYAGAQTPSVDHLQSRYDRGLLRLHEPADSALLEKMRRSAGDSRHMAADHYDVLCRQGLV